MIREITSISVPLSIRGEGPLEEVNLATLPVVQVTPTLPETSFREALLVPGSIVGIEPTYVEEDESGRILRQLSPEEVLQYKAALCSDRLDISLSGTRAITPSSSALSPSHQEQP